MGSFEVHPRLADGLEVDVEEAISRVCSAVLWDREKNVGVKADLLCALLALLNAWDTLRTKR